MKPRSAGTRFESTGRSRRLRPVCVFGCACVLSLAAGMATAAATAAPAAGDSAFALSPADSLLRARGSRWGEAPPRATGSAVVVGNRDRPLWEDAVMVPYTVIGIPFWGLNWLIKSSAVALEHSGLLNIFSEIERGIPGPFGSYMLPTFAISDARGWQYGLVLHRPRFLAGPHRLRLEASYSSQRSEQLNLGTRFQLSPAQRLVFGAGYDANPGTKYYGLGRDSREQGKSYYEREVGWVGLNTTRRLSGSLAVGARAIYTSARARSAGRDDEDHEPLEEVHAGNLPPGFGEGSRGWNAGLFLKHDSTTETGRASHGGVRLVGLDHFAATDGSGVTFWTYRGDLQQFFRLGHPQRTLAVRIFLMKIENTGDRAVPFQRLVSNRDPDLFRGYVSSRFLDEGLVGLNVDYRWTIFSIQDPADVGVDAFLGYDTGQAFAGYHEIGLRYLRDSGVFGLRVIGPGGAFALRAELGFSAEGTVFRLDFSQIFQDAREGLYDGKIPIPAW